MVITGMAHFQSVCKRKLVNWYNNQVGATKIDLDNVFIVWSCKTLQNYKCLASTTVSGDGIYAEYTYNGDKQELYEDIYDKVQNTCHTEEFCYCLRFFLWCRFESLHFPDPRQSRDACALTGYLYTAQRVCLVLFFLFLKRSIFFQVIKHSGYSLP